jgi:hypothetical protein
MGIDKLTWLVFWVSALACYRVTVLITRCLGPLGIFARLRAIPAFTDFLKCPYCVSIYVGAATCVGLYLTGLRLQWPMWVMLAFSFSAVTIALDRVFSSDHSPQ